ncbi:MAG: FxsA family protein [Candidatus Tectimicrobiota bacterium]
MLYLIALFIGIPLLELALLIKLGAAIGTAKTLLIVVGTGIVGAALARSQGFTILQRIQMDLEAGHLPTDDLINGACVLAGGLLLLTPGLLTDTVGFALLVPPTRELLKESARRYIQRKLDRGEVIVVTRFGRRL